MLTIAGGILLAVAMVFVGSIALAVIAAPFIFVFQFFRLAMRKRKPPVQHFYEIEDDYRAGSEFY